MRKLIMCGVIALVVAFWLGIPPKVQAQSRQPDSEIYKAADLKTRIKIDDKIELLNAEVDQETGTRFSYFWIWDGGFRSNGERPDIETCHGYWIPVIGEVPTTVDLTNDSETQKIIENAKKYAFKMCPNLGKEIRPVGIGKTRQSIWIHLYSEKFDKSRIEKNSPVFAWFDPYDDPTYSRLGTYKNRIKEDAQRKIQQEEQQRKNEETKKRQIAEDAARLASEKEQEVRRQAERLEQQKVQQQKAGAEKQRVINLRDAFVNKNSVQAWPNANTLQANPFVYQGKTVAIVAQFGEMSSATEGLFQIGERNIVFVSDIPNGAFTSERWVVLAGTVVGKKEVQLPLLGKVAVTHIKYVGVMNCSDQQCNGMGK